MTDEMTKNEAEVLQDKLREISVDRLNAPLMDYFSVLDSMNEANAILKAAMEEAVPEEGDIPPPVDTMRLMIECMVTVMVNSFIRVPEDVIPEVHEHILEIFMDVPRMALEAKAEMTEETHGHA